MASGQPSGDPQGGSGAAGPPLPPLLTERAASQNVWVALAPDGGCTSPLHGRQIDEAVRQGYRIFSRTVTTTDWYEQPHPALDSGGLHGAHTDDT